MRLPPTLFILQARSNSVVRCNKEKALVWRMSVHRARQNSGASTPSEQLQFPPSYSNISWKITQIKLRGFFSLRHHYKILQWFSHGLCGKWTDFRPQGPISGGDEDCHIESPALQPLVKIITGLSLATFSWREEPHKYRGRHDGGRNNTQSGEGGGGWSMGLVLWLQHCANYNYPRFTISPWWHRNWMKPRIVSLYWLGTALSHKAQGRGVPCRQSPWISPLTLALGLTQSLAEMSTGNFRGSKGQTCKGD
jgi:hypothetical protein